MLHINQTPWEFIIYDSKSVLQQQLNAMVAYVYHVWGREDH